MQITSIFHRLTFANVTSSLALFIALGGASYAAIKVPANSVGTKQVKNRAITTRKLDRKVLTSLRGATGARGLAGPQGVAGPQGLQGPKGDTGASGAAALADGSITASKLAGSSVTQAKLGLTTGFAYTGVDATANKALLATCPAGTSVIGGAVMVVDQAGSPLNGVAAVSYSGPAGVISPHQWEGVAYRTAGSASYGLDVIAFCSAA
jgi:hypothetical protein